MRTELKDLKLAQTDATKQFFILPKAWMCCPWNSEFHLEVWLKGHTAIKEKIRTENSVVWHQKNLHFRSLKGIWLTTYCLSPGAAKFRKVAEHVVLIK